MIQLIVTHRPRITNRPGARRRPETFRWWTKKISNEAPSLVLTDARDIRMHFVCSSFLGRPTSLQSSIIVSPSSCPCSLSVLAFSSPIRLLYIFLSFWAPFDSSAHPSRAYTYFFFFLATAWHKSSFRSTPKFRHSRLGFQRVQHVQAH